MSNDFDDEFDDDFEDEEEGGPAGETFEEMLRRLAASGNLTTRHVGDDDEEGESHEISVAEFLAQISGLPQSDSDDDYDGDEEEDEEEGGQQFSMGFGLGSDGSVTRLDDDSSGGLSFSFTLDQDGEEVPEIRCPKCNKKDTDVLDWDTDTYKCNSCGYEFIPEIYKVLDSAEDYLDRSWYNFQQRNFKRAIRDANAAINLEPNNRKAYLSRGKALVEREELEQAESDFSEAIRISPDYDVAYFERGKTRMFLHKFDEAITDFTKSIGFDPDFAETYRLRAVAHLQQERYDEAIKDLSEAIKLDPNEAQSWFERGYNYSLLGEHQIAIQDYSEAITRDPNHRDAFVRRAESFEKIDRYQDAITDYKNFLRTIGKGSTADEITGRINTLQLKLDPNAEPVTFDPDEEPSIWEDVTLTQERKEYRSADRGEDLLNEGDLDGAYKEFSAYIKNVPNSVLPYIYRACVNLKAGKLEEAIKDLTGAIECGAEIIPDSEQNPFVAMFSEGTDPRNKDVYLMRTFVHSLMGKHEEVQKDLVNHLLFNLEKSYLQGIWSRHTSNFTAVEALSGVFARTVTEKEEQTRTPLQNAILSLVVDDRDSALETIEEAIQADPKNPVNYWVRSLSQDDSEDAFEDLATATELAGGKAEHFYVQGFKKLLSGKTREGREDLLKAIRLDPNNAEYHEKLGVFLSKNNQHDEAIEHLTKAVELNPDSKDAYYTRGVSLDWKGETEAALEDLEKAITLGDKPGNLKTKTAQEKIQEIRESETKKQALLSKLVSSSERLGSASEYLARGETYLKEAKWEQAYTDFNQAIQLEPNNVDAYRHRGATFYKLGDAKSALKDYNQAIALDPHSSDLFLNRGILQADSGDSQNALADLDEAIRLNPSNAMAYHMRAKVHAENIFIEESMDQATDDFEKAIELNPNDPQVYFSRAEFWCQPCFQGAEGDALADLDQAIRLAPENAEYYLARFKIKADIKDVTGASEDLTKAYQLDPSNEEVKALVQKLTGGDGKHSQVVRLLMSAQEKMNANDLAGSIEDLKKASELEPDDESVKNILSKIPPSMLNGIGNLGEDSDGSDESREKAAYLLKRGFDKYQGKDYDGCIEDVSKAILLRSSDPIYYSIRGMAYRDKELEDEAFNDFSEAIRLGSDNCSDYLFRGQIYIIRDQFEKALADFDKVIKQKLGEGDVYYSFAYFYRGRAHLGMGKVAEAISDLTTAIPLDPEQAAPYYYRAEAYKELREFKSAISDFQTYLEMTDEEEDQEEVLSFIQELSASLSSDTSAPSKPMLSPESKKVELANAHILRASELKESRDFVGALKEVQLAKYIIPDDKLPYEMAFAIYNDMEDWDNAIANLQEVIRIKPDDVMSHKNLGALKTKVGDLDGAVADLIKATKLDPKHAQSHLFLGVAYLMQSKYDQAKESLTKSIDLDPSVPVAYLHRASTKEKLKDYPAAIPDFEKYCALGGSPEVPDLTPLREHIEYLKKEYGVTDVKKDEGRYSVILKSAKNLTPEQKIEVIKLVRNLFRVGLYEARDISEKETVIGTDMSFDEASSMVCSFKDIGADAQLVKSILPLDIEIQRSIQRMKQLAEQNLREQEEQNRKQVQYEERKQKLQKEIEERNLKLEQMKRETAQQVDSLRKERESLGFLAMGKKKEIDQKILSLEKQLSDSGAKIDSLRSQLRNLKP